MTQAANKGSIPHGHLGSGLLVIFKSLGVMHGSFGAAAAKALTHSSPTYRPILWHCIIQELSL